MYLEHSATPRHFWSPNWYQHAIAVGSLRKRRSSAERSSREASTCYVFFSRTSRSRTGQSDTMLRFGTRGKVVCLEAVENYLDSLGNLREFSVLANVSGLGSKGGFTGQLRSLIDAELPKRKTAVVDGRCSFSSVGQEPRKTCLYELHRDHHGKIVNFAGWLLPVQYQDAIAVSHQHTRTLASLFDVGHMLQTRVFGKDAAELLESVTTCDLRNLKKGAATLTVFTNDKGGILDDLIITKDEEEKYFVVSNAGRRDEDSQLLLQRQEEFKGQGKDVSIEFLDPLEQGLIALQGPSSHAVLQPLVKVDLKNLKFMNCVETEILGAPVRISRCGYTGEDGFEISVSEKHARNLVEKILEVPEAKLAGLGARDTLRLEAGLCLYGHDINEETTPVEAALTWLVAKRRRAERNFPGAERILSDIKLGPNKKRVGLTLAQGPPAREGAPILTPEGERVGTVTSGAPSPTLGKPIAMGYVPTDLAQFGGGVLVEVRGKTYKATITKMPFVKANYFTAK